MNTTAFVQSNKTTTPNFYAKTIKFVRKSEFNTLKPRKHVRLNKTIVPRFSIRVFRYQDGTVQRYAIIHINDVWGLEHKLEREGEVVDWATGTFKSYGCARSATSNYLINFLSEEAIANGRKAYDYDMPRIVKADMICNNGHIIE